MNSRRMEFSIGIMVIGIVIAVFIMTVLFQSENHFIGGGGGPHMTIKFSDGTGISANSLVLKNGIKIGRVASVVLHDKPDESYVEVEIELKPEAKIYSNEVAKINRTFLGDASIEIVDDPNFDKSKARVEREAGDILESSKSSDFVT